MRNVVGEVVPKRCYREGDTPSRTLPRTAISNGKPFTLLVQNGGHLRI
ncbi:hypothetical protein L21_2078 [Methanoculleus chikugoensis]|uniref:Uncharacterized protein n=1 Tax=Methanoculleus chikugoensis TaxID=118126 RepID=A0A1M4MMS4_9EURY|nr:hypothetical protein L21_2078 [Methanoculleus chikugoensis]